jgi:hypothetical protein
LTRSDGVCPVGIVRPGRYRLVVLGALPALFCRVKSAMVAAWGCPGSPAALLASVVYAAGATAP